MKRTTIFGDEAVLKILRELAHRQKTSLSALIRTALEEYAGKHHGTPNVLTFFAVREGRTRER